MPELRRVRARWNEIDSETRRWSQGDLVCLPYAVWSYVPEFPAAPESLQKVKQEVAEAGGTLSAPDDDVVLLEGELPAVIVTQSCDLVERVQNEPCFLAALIDRLPDPDEAGIDSGERAARDRSWRRVVSGANLGRFAIAVFDDGIWTHEVLGPGRWFVDLRTLYPVEKGKLLQVAKGDGGPRTGVPKVLRKEFALRLQERMGRDELPDVVDRNFFAPLVERLRHLRTDGTEQEQMILNGMVREIRYIVEPADSRNYLIKIFVCFTEDCPDESDERGAAVALFNGLIGEFTGRAIDASVKSVRFVGADLLEMSALEYRDSTRLNWSVAA